MSEKPRRVFGGIFDCYLKLVFVTISRLLSSCCNETLYSIISFSGCNVFSFIYKKYIFFLYIKEKRSSYPRLYFLSDEDLLELVSASGRGLEAHLSKLYQGVGSIIKDDNGLTAVVSPEGEVLQLSKPVDLRDSLPRWLSNLEEGMKNALRQSLEKCLMDTTPDPSSYPTQVTNLSFLSVV